MSISAWDAKQRLIDGNRTYLNARINPGDISLAIRHKTAADGQKPYAVVLCCSDSREIPEAIFSAGIGDLFVIRVAGNVVDSHQLGSIIYAAEHLGTKLVVVLGHDHCGAVDAAMHHAPDGHIRTITDKINAAIGTETDGLRACCLNAVSSAREIREDPEVGAIDGVVVLPALYHIESGEVEFLTD